MAIGKLQEILKQLDAINPEELKQSMKGDSSPELVECLQSVRQKLEKILDIIIKAIEGDYRTAPRLPECTQEAIVPVEQPALPRMYELDTERDALEKLKILEGIKSNEYKQLLKEKFGQISAASIKLLQKMDKIFAGLGALKGKKSKFGPQLPYNTQPLMLKIIELLIDNITHEVRISTASGERSLSSQEKPVEKNNPDRGSQAERLKPYIRYLLRELSFLDSLWVGEPKKFKTLQSTIIFLEFLTLLFRDNDSNIFDLKCRGTDLATTGFWADKCPLPLLLAGNYNYWQSRSDWGDGTRNNLGQKLVTMLPKFQGMQKWLETNLFGNDRRSQLLTLMMNLTPAELEKLDPDSCCRFFAFLEKADAAARLKSCSQKERADFILAGEYTFNALGKVLSKSSSSANPP